MAGRILAVSKKKSFKCNVLVRISNGGLCETMNNQM